MQPGADMSAMLNAIDKDLGNIKLEIDAQVLGSVTVVSSKPQFQLGIDRKIYNVEKDVIAAGGTAVDVMKNVPSLSVDLDGNVTLRNNTPQIFVDGRPTTMQLEQIPADAIESVEIITNPSAKYDASGGTSGILNIVLKKNKKVGYNGSLRSSIDSRAKIGLGADFSLRQNKINVFGSANYNQRKSISTGYTDRTNILIAPSFTRMTIARWLVILNFSELVLIILLITGTLFLPAQILAMEYSALNQLVKCWYSRLTY
jgi:outer membrane receptor protein involved in Fe transport